MDLIFHEKQEGSLCAQHSLNALLQGPYYTAIDLAELANQLDSEERSELARAGLDSDDYQRHLHDGSHNMDDSGFFSIQVIYRALQVFGLELVPYQRQCHEAELARQDPTTQRAYICNFRQHWLTVRRLGCQWFNLNSLLSGPQLISDTYLALFLTQLQQEGYSIFIVLGPLPESAADEQLMLRPVPPEAAQGPLQRPLQKATEKSNPGASTSDNSIDEDNDPEMAVAMAICREEHDAENVTLQRVLEATRREAEEDELASVLRETQDQEEEEELKRAIALSLQTDQDAESSRIAIRHKRQAFLDRLDNPR